MIRAWWFLTVLLAALGLVMGGAHALEMPVRMSYDATFYMEVTSTLYLYFGLVGGPIQVLALLAAVALAWLLRGRDPFRWAAAGAAFLGLSLVLWFVLVQTVNAQWADALGSGQVEAVDAYIALGRRWETGHLAAFAAWLAGFVCLLWGTVRSAAAATEARGR